MDENLTAWKLNRRMVVALIVVLVLIISIPVGIYLARQQQILKSRASAPQPLPPETSFSLELVGATNTTDDQRERARIFTNQINSSTGGSQNNGGNTGNGQTNGGVSQGGVGGSTGNGAVGGGSVPLASGGSSTDTGVSGGTSNSSTGGSSGANGPTGGTTNGVYGGSGSSGGSTGTIRGGSPGQNGVLGDIQSRVFRSGELILAKLLVRSDIDASNLFAAKINFPSDLLEVKSIRTGSADQCPPPPTCSGQLIVDEHSLSDLDRCPVFSCQPLPTFPNASFPSVNIPNSAGKACVQVITKACSVTNPDICKDFPTPCDVPAGWVTGNGGNPVASSSAFPIPFPTPPVNLTYFIRNWAERTSDNNQGTISLVGGVPSPGFKTDSSQRSGLMAIIVFQAKKVGTASISFTDNSAIYRNSDNVNILTKKNNLTLTISDTVPTPIGIPSFPPFPSGFPFPSGLPLPSGFVLPSNFPLPSNLVRGGSCSSDSDCQVNQRCIHTAMCTRDNPNCPGVCIGQVTPSSIPVIIPSSVPTPSPLITPSPTPAALKGDADHDGKVDLVDLSILFSNFLGNVADHPELDFNNDGVINSFDFIMMTKVLIQNGIIGSGQTASGRKPCTTNADCSSDETCLDPSPVARVGDQLVCWPNGQPHPICLASNTLIDTPSGQVNVKDLKEGMSVYSLDSSGQKIVSKVAKVSNTLVPSTHQVVHLVLGNGKEVWASPNHPTVNGKEMADLNPGDTYNGSQVVSVSLVKYWDDRTYDLLPDSQTGYYFANGIPLASTLKN